ncbi:MAG: MerR family DNA-binding transcriptional regulator [Pseudonocardiaceae bacterium]
MSGLSIALASPTLGVTELAEKSGVAPSAIRFYESNGLIPAVRTSGNQRRFHEVSACVVKIIRVAQRVGLSVAEIRRLTDQLPKPEEIAIADWAWLRQQLEDEVRLRIAALNEVLDDLTEQGKLCEVPAARSR